MNDLDLGYIKEISGLAEQIDRRLEREERKRHLSEEFEQIRILLQEIKSRVDNYFE